MAGFIREDGWRRSSHSGAENCVECAATSDAILVRDSKDPAGPALRFAPERWSEFLAAVKDGSLTDSNLR